ncbi:hypothetical protein DAPPUDRAFT_340718 [Daphnia pulex]|uniref:G-protein coupled receptors family 1 profile domain-containing protein n=1 Tax=Daphnia pulex TaxID=6669 RepID=E9I4M7_DAPPU|nr:hypothetical protein DAPPUDRAFT_340718 [Daphnia pulex]|eukprot:EFX61054.1 hypothetical protein DAPPUDRAFT_340718 [Daphnia pulex]
MNNTSQDNRDFLNPNFNVNTFLVTTKLFCCSLGIPLNLQIVKTIIRLLRLGYKSRHIFLLSVFVSYLLTFVHPLVELTYCAILPLECGEFVCVVLVVISGLPHALLLLNMCLALTDRFLAIKFPLMHQNKMTSRLAKSTIIVCNISLVFHLKFVYIMGIAPLRCEIWLVHITVVELTILILFVSYIILSVVVYRQTEGRFRASETSRTPGGAFDQEMVVIAGGIVTESRQLTTYGSEFLDARPLRNRSANNVRPAAEPVPVDRDLEASRSLVMVIPLVLTVCPLLILLLAFLFCQLSSQFDCSIFTWLVTYFKELSLIQAVYNPLIFLWKNEELRKALLAIN